MQNITLVGRSLKGMHPPNRIGSATALPGLISLWQLCEFWSYEAKFTDGQCVEIACIEYEKPTQDNGYKTE
jgi:hypothetical protein